MTEEEEFAARMAAESSPAQSSEAAEFAARLAAEKSAPAEIDYMAGYNIPQRLAIGAGKATNDFLGTFGLNPVDGFEPADKAADKDTAAQVGGAIAQAGMMYTGGQALRDVIPLHVVNFSRG